MSDTSALKQRLLARKVVLEPISEKPLRNAWKEALNAEYKRRELSSDKIYLETNSMLCHLFREFSGHQAVSRAIIEPHLQEEWKSLNNMVQEHPAVQMKIRMLNAVRDAVNAQISVPIVLGQPMAVPPPPC